MRFMVTILVASVTVGAKLLNSTAAFIDHQGFTIIDSTFHVACRGRQEFETRIAAGLVLIGKGFPCERNALLLRRSREVTYFSFA